MKWKGEEGVRKGERWWGKEGRREERREVEREGRKERGREGSGERREEGSVVERVGGSQEGWRSYSIVQLIVQSVDCVLTGRVTERTENMTVEEGGRTYSTRVSPQLNTPHNNADNTNNTNSHAV